MRKVLLDRMEEDRCIPWYFPPVDPDVRLCSPYEARDFKKEMESIAAHECKVIYDNELFKILRLYAGLIRSLKIGNVWVFLLLIHKPTWTRHQLY